MTNATAMLLLVASHNQGRVMRIYYAGDEPMSAAEERVVFEAMKTATAEQKQKLVTLVVNANVSFALSEAKRWMNEIDDEDLVQVAVVAMLEAIDRFEIDRGHKFITYAVWWIRCRIRAHVFSRPLITIPTSAFARAKALQEECEILEKSLRRSVALEEVLVKSRITLKEASALQNMARISISLDDHARSGDDSVKSEKHELIPDANAADPLDEAERTQLCEQVRVVMDTLPPRYRDVLRMYFGFHGPAMTLQEIGDKIGVTRERTRQIRNNAMEALRNRLAEAFDIGG